MWTVVGLPELDIAVAQNERSVATRTALANWHDWRQNGGYLRGSISDPITLRDEKRMRAFGLLLARRLTD